MHAVCAVVRFLLKKYLLDGNCEPKVLFFELTGMFFIITGKFELCSTPSAPHALALALKHTHIMMRAASSGRQLLRLANGEHFAWERTREFLNKHVP